jgi:hypothetical protein
MNVCLSIVPAAARYSPKFLKKLFGIFWGILASIQGCQLMAISY